MKVKHKFILIIAFISLMLSIFVLGFGISSVVASADTGASETQPLPDPAGEAADETNNAIKEWVTVILGGIDTVFSAGVLGLLSFKKKESVAVTVNDKDTQDKLEALHAENTKLTEAVVAMLKLEKGTQDVLKALYADNPNLDNKVRDIINEVALNAEDLIKDVKDIFDKENSEKVKQVFEAVSNIVLG